MPPEAVQPALQPLANRWLDSDLVGRKRDPAFGTAARLFSGVQGALLRFLSALHHAWIAGVLLPVIGASLLASVRHVPG